MKLKTRSSVFAALSAAVLFFAAAPAAAQCGISAFGHGTYFSPTSQNTPSFTFFLTERHNGSVQGFAIWRGASSTIFFELSSAMYLPPPYAGSLAAAGRILCIIGTPGPGLPATVGATAFFAVNDNGGNGPDENSGLSVIPSPFPVPIPPQFGNLTTIQQITAFGQATNRSITWRPLLSGNIRIR